MSERPPNFLIFIVDQMSGTSLSAHGNPDVRSPHIDQLAQVGTDFRAAYCNNSVCMPSRASLLTGLTPRQHGLTTNGMSLSDSIPTVTQALSNKGYRTHSIGKLHLQPMGGFNNGQEVLQSCERASDWKSGKRASLPRPYYGFQDAELVGGHVWGAFGDYLNWLRQHNPEAANALVSRRTTRSVGTLDPSIGERMDLPREYHYNDWIARRAGVFLEAQNENQPFFLWCSFPDPHFPFAACHPFNEMYDPAAISLNPTWNQSLDLCPFLQACRQVHKKRFAFDETTLREIVAQTYGMISHIDDCIGKVLDSLEHAGLEENTVVVFMADHGEYLGSHGLITKAEWPWEDLWRIPFIWRTPKGRSGQCAESPVSLLDFVPTVLDELVPKVWTADRVN